MSHQALTPKWLLGHMIALGAIVLFINLGFWQLSRLDEKKSANTQIEMMMNRPIVSIDEAESTAWQQVTASGHYLIEKQVLVRSRSQNSVSGYHVVTPFEYSPGKVLLINRGFVPLTVGDSSLDQDAPAPTGEVQVVGLLRETQTRGSIGARDPSEGILAVVSRVDIERIAMQTEGEIFPLWLQLTEQTPTPGPLPDYLPKPELDEGPHLSYALQWFMFTAIVLIGYPLILRKAFAKDKSVT